VLENMVLADRIAVIVPELAKHQGGEDG